MVIKEAGLHALCIQINHIYTLAEARIQWQFPQLIHMTMKERIGCCQGINNVDRIFLEAYRISLHMKNMVNGHQCSCVKYHNRMIICNEAGFISFDSSLIEHMHMLVEAPYAAGDRSYYVIQWIKNAWCNIQLSIRDYIDGTGVALFIVQPKLILKTLLRKRLLCRQYWILDNMLIIRRNSGSCKNRPDGLKSSVVMANDYHIVLQGAHYLIPDEALTHSSCRLFGKLPVQGMLLYQQYNTVPTDAGELAGNLVLIIPARIIA